MELQEIKVHENIELIKISARFQINKSSEYAAPVKSTNAVVDLARTLIGDNEIDLYESVFALYLNAQNIIVTCFKISEGSNSGANVSVLKVLQGAVLSNAVSVIVFHNHPSGSCEASKADLKFTQKLKQGLSAMDIRFLDSIIITRDDYVSLLLEEL